MPRQCTMFTVHHVRILAQQRSRDRPNLCPTYLFKLAHYLQNAIRHFILVQKACLRRKRSPDRLRCRQLSRNGRRCLSRNARSYAANCAASHELRSECAKIRHYYIATDPLSDSSICFTPVDIPRFCVVCVSSSCRLRTVRCFHRWLNCVR